MKSPLLSSTGAAQFAKFVVVGCINVAVGFVVFVFLYRFFPPVTTILSAAGRLGTHVGDYLGQLGIPSVDASVAYTLGAGAGMGTSFVLNKYWTFCASGLTALQLRRFVALNVGNISASTALMFFLVDLMHVPYLLVWIGITGLAMLVNFFVNKHWTFAVDPSFESPPEKASPDGSL